jgi:hypothetical protein
MDVFLSCLYVVGRGLCDGLITRREESYRASNFMIKKPRKGPYVPVGNYTNMDKSESVPNTLDLMNAHNGGTKA